MAGSKRERELARAKYERQQARRAQSDDKRRKRTQVIASVVIGALVLAGFAALAVSLRHKSASTSAAAEASNRAVCLYSPSGTAARKVDRAGREHVTEPGHQDGDPGPDRRAPSPSSCSTPRRRAR